MVIRIWYHNGLWIVKCWKQDKVQWWMIWEKWLEILVSMKIVSELKLDSVDFGYIAIRASFSFNLLDIRKV